MIDYHCMFVSKSGHVLTPLNRSSDLFQTSAVTDTMQYTCNSEEYSMFQHPVIVHGSLDDNPN